MLPQVNPAASVPDTVPTSQPITGAELAANKHRYDAMTAGQVLVEPTNWGTSGPYRPEGGNRAFPDQLNGNTYGAAVLGSPYRPLYTLSPYGEPVPKGGSRAPANQLRPAGTGWVVTVSPEGPVVVAPPGVASLPTK